MLVMLLGRILLPGMKFDLSDGQRWQEMPTIVEVGVVDLEDILRIGAVGEHFGKLVAVAPRLDIQ